MSQFDYPLGPDLSAEVPVSRATPIEEFDFGKLMVLNEPTEEVTGWIASCSFPAAEAEAAMRRIYQLPKPGLPIFEKPRSWRERLFSRPWRPWHNVKRWVSTGIVEWAEYQENTLERAVIRVGGSGRINMETARV